jgi:hypothetical protein
MHSKQQAHVSKLGTNHLLSSLFNNLCTFIRHCAGNQFNVKQRASLTGFVLWGGVQIINLLESDSSMQSKRKYCAVFLPPQFALPHPSNSCRELRCKGWLLFVVYCHCAV